MTIVMDLVGGTLGLFLLALLFVASWPVLLGNGSFDLPVIPQPPAVSWHPSGDGTAAISSVEALPIDIVTVETKIKERPREPSVIVVWHGVSGNSDCTAKVKTSPSAFGFTHSAVPHNHGVSAFLTGFLHNGPPRPCAVPFAVMMSDGEPVPGASYPIVGIAGVGCTATFTPSTTAGTTPANGDGHFSLWCGPPGPQQEPLTKQTLSAYSSALKKSPGLIRPAAEVG